MTIDERIAKLAERHEALTQSVEILTNDLSELQDLVSQLAEGTAGQTAERIGKVIHRPFPPVQISGQSPQS